MKVLALLCALILFSLSSLAQTAKPSDLQTVGGFLKVCAPDKQELNKKRAEAVAKAPASEAMDMIKKGMADELADHALCLGYLNGLVEGWKEGQAHGVLAVYFPGGVPDDLQEGLKSLSKENLEAGSAAMKNDKFCLPEHMTFGELEETVVKQFRVQVAKNPFFHLLLTSRLFHTALRDAYPCKQAPRARE